MRTQESRTSSKTTDTWGEPEGIPDAGNRGLQDPQFPDPCAGVGGTARFGEPHQATSLRDFFAFLALFDGPMTGNDGRSSSMRRFGLVMYPGSMPSSLSTQPHLWPLTYKSPQAQFVDICGRYNLIYNQLELINNS